MPGLSFSLKGTHSSLLYAEQKQKLSRLVLRSLRHSLHAQEQKSKKRNKSAEAEAMWLCLGGLAGVLRDSGLLLYCKCWWHGNSLKTSISRVIAFCQKSVGTIFSLFSSNLFRSVTFESEKALVVPGDIFISNSVITFLKINSANNSN